MIDVVTAFFSVPLGFQHVLLLSHFVGLAPDVLESIRQKEAEMEAIQNEEVQLDVVQLLDCFLLKNQPKKGEAIAWCHGSMQQIMYIFVSTCIDIQYADVNMYSGHSGMSCVTSMRRRGSGRA